MLRSLGAAGGGGELSRPLARVGGHLADPEFGFAPEAATELAKQVLSGGALRRVDRAIDTLVPGVSKALESGLGALFGGAAKSGEETASEGEGKTE